MFAKKKQKQKTKKPKKTTHQTSPPSPIQKKKPNNIKKVINQFKKPQPSRFLWEISSLTYEHTYVNLVNYIHSMNSLV